MDHQRTLELASYGPLLAINFGNSELRILNVKEEDPKLEKLNELYKLEENPWIVDHKTCGNGENKVVLLTKKGTLAVFKFGKNGSGLSHLQAKIQIPFKINRREYSRTLAICSTSTYFAVHLKTTSKASRILIYKHFDGTLTYIHEIDLLEEKLSYFYAMNFQKYYQGCLVLAAASCDFPAEFLTFFMEFNTNKLKEVKEFRKPMKRTRYPVHLVNCGNFMSGVDYYGKIIKVSYLS